MPEVKETEKKEPTKEVAKDLAKEKKDVPKGEAKKTEEEKPEKDKVVGEEKLGEEKEKKAEEKPKKGRFKFKFKFKLAIPPIVKYIVISLVAFVILVVAAYTLASKVIKPFMKTQIEKSTTQKKKAVVKRKAQATKVREVFLVSDMIVNPAETGGTRFLNVTIGLGVGDEEAKMVLEERSPQIRDALISILTTKTIPQLVHPDGKKILRNEIVRKINKIVTPHHILQVYFVDFVLQ